MTVTIHYTERHYTSDLLPGHASVRMIIWERLDKTGFNCMWILALSVTFVKTCCSIFLILLQQHGFHEGSGLQKTPL